MFGEARNVFGETYCEDTWRYQQATLVVNNESLEAQDACAKPSSTSLSAFQAFRRVCLYGCLRQEGLIWGTSPNSAALCFFYTMWIVMSFDTDDVCSDAGHVRGTFASEGKRAMYKERVEPHQLRVCQKKRNLLHGETFDNLSMRCAKSFGPLFKLQATCSRHARLLPESACEATTVSCCTKYHPSQIHQQLLATTPAIPIAALRAALSGDGATHVDKHLPL